MRLTALLYVFTSFTVANSAVADNHQLDFRPIAAEYSAALDRVILISATPNRLNIYNPALRAYETVALPQAPVALSVGPDSTRAAVMMTDTIAYVNLTNRSIEKTFPFTRGEYSYQNGIVLAQNWIHLANGTAIQISNGETRTNIGFGPGARLHPSGTAIYTTRDGTSPNDIIRVDVTMGSTPSGADSPYHGDYPVCGPIWFSRDGSRAYNSCNTVFAATPSTPSTDVYYLTQFNTTAPPNQYTYDPARWIVESSQGIVAVGLGGANYPQTPLADGQRIQLYSQDYLRRLGTLQLTPVTVGQRTYLNLNRWLFFNNAGTELYVIAQADTASGLLNDYAVQTFPLGAPPACLATFDVSQASAPASGALAYGNISASTECIFRVTSDAPSWLTVVENGYGSGNTQFTYRTMPNTTGATRSGTLSLGSQKFTVTQAPSDSSVSSTFQRLGVPVADAEYNKTNDTIVFVTQMPPELHIYNPVTRSSSIVPLVRNPIAVSVRPDGAYAAVGHEGWVSIVNLQSAAVERVIKVITDVGDLILAGNGYFYAYPQRSWSDIYSYNLATNVLTPLSAIYQGRTVRLKADMNAIYAADSWYSKWDISQGPLRRVNSFAQSICGPFWFTETGNRIITACGTVARASVVESEDGTPNGRLSDTNSVTWMDHSASQQLIAVSTGEQYGSEIQLYRNDDLLLRSRTAAPRFPVDSIDYQSAAQWLFWNRAGGRLYSIIKAPANANLLSGNGVAEVPVQLCTFNLTAPSGATSSTYVGGTFAIQVVTQPGCRWTPQVSTGTFLTLNGNISGEGSGSFQLQIQPNTVNAPRSGSIVVGEASLQFSQAPNTGTISLGSTTIDLPRTGASGNVAVTATNSYVGWTVTSPGNNNWIYAYGSAGSGNGYVQYSVSENPTGSAARTATFLVNNQLLTFRQAGSGAAGPTVSPASSLIGERGGTLQFSVTTADSWNAIPEVSWIQVTNGRSGTGNGTVTILVERNYLSKPRSGIVRLAGSSYTVTQSAQTALLFHPVTPCRVADTRTNSTTLAAQATRSFGVSASACGIPATAAAYAMNVTVVPQEGLGYLTIYPTGTDRPLASLLNSLDGRIKANTAIVPAGTNGEVSVFVTNRTDVILDVNGYFEDVTAPNGLAFFPINPCRVTDSRLSNGNAGGPSLTDGGSRAISIAGACGIPAGAQAVALNVTALPKTTLGYLTVWPTGQQRPLASTLNAVTGTITANSMLAPLGTNGSIDLFANNATDFLLDVSGYFAPSAPQSGIAYFVTPPCRIFDTRVTGTPFAAATPTGVDAAAATSCQFSREAAALALSVTAVPIGGSLGYLSLWSPGQSMPVVSTLNAVDGALTSNFAIVPGYSGLFNGFSSNSTHVFFDLSGYFAPY